MDLELYQKLLPDAERAPAPAFEIGEWPERHVAHPAGSPTYSPRPFHFTQNYAWNCALRIIALIAGSKGGKTSFGPWKLWQWIKRFGGGDYYAVTSTYDLFNIKMLPAMLQTFREILGVGRYWAQKRLIELRDPSGRFLAEKADDLMWGRIILRAAEARGGLEAGDAKAIWMDEAGQSAFDIQTYRALRRRAALYKAPMLITTTLYDIGWLDFQIIDPLKKAPDARITIHHDGEAEAEITESEKLGISLVQFDSILNPEYPYEEFEEARESLPDDEFQAFHRGRRGVSQTLIYYTFDHDNGVCIPFEIPGSWPRYWGIDFGPVHFACIFYAEDPDSHPDPKERTLYCYREYMAGGKTLEQHLEDLRDGEIVSPKKVTGGTWGSEEQWRRELRKLGLPIEKPSVFEFETGVRRVREAHRRGQLVYFEGLEIIEDKRRYRRKRDRLGNIIDTVEHKQTFHRLDGERYIIATIRPYHLEGEGRTVAW